MSRTPGPAIAGKRLRSNLVKLRDERKIKQSRIIDELGWSASKIHRIENGPSRIQTDDVLELLDFYGVKDQKVRDRFVEDARLSRMAGISTRYKNVLSPSYVEYLDYEAFADHVISYQTKFIPGVLQQGGYAHAVSGTPGSDEEDVNRRADARNERAQFLLKPDGPSLEFIIDEAALHRAIGSTERRWSEKYNVMKAVIRNLQELNTAGRSRDDVSPLLNPNVSIRIVPLEWDYYDAYNGPFVILDFDAPDYPSVLYLEYPNPQPLIFDPKQVEDRRTEFETMKASIPPASETNRLLAFIQEKYDVRLAESPLRPAPT